MSIKDKSYDISKLPRIYNMYIREYFPEVNFTEGQGDTQIRICNIPDEDTIALSEFYDAYCEENDFQPTEKEASRLMRAMISKDVAEQKIAKAVIFKISNQHKTLKKALIFFNNFLNVENFTAKEAFEIQTINNSVRDFLECEPYIQLQRTSEQDKLDLREYVNQMVKIYSEKHIGES